MKVLAILYSSINNLRKGLGMKIFFLILVILFFCSTIFVIAQTSENGNYNVYSREYQTSSIGYYRTSINVYDKVNLQRGISYTRYYDIATIGEIPIDQYNTQVGFYLTGSYRLGATTGENVSDLLSNEKNKFYVGSLDLFSLFLTSDITYVIDRSYSVTTRLGINLINVGGSLAFQDKRKFKETYMASFNIIPLVISPAVFFDFGRSGLGILLYYNTFNILQYDLVAKTLTDKTSGLKSMDVLIKKYDFQLIFTF
jgi:hypothetical protein